MLASIYSPIMGCVDKCLTSYGCCYGYCSVEPPSKRPRLSVSEATEDDEMTTEEFTVDDNITEEVLLCGRYVIM